MVSGARVLSLSSVRSHLAGILITEKIHNNKNTQDSDRKDYKVTSIFYLPAGKEGSYFFRVKDCKECNTYDDEASNRSEEEYQISGRQNNMPAENISACQGHEQTNMEHICAIQYSLSPPPGFN